MTTQKNVWRISLIISILLYTASLTQDCFYAKENCYNSAFVLVVGWLSVPCLGANLAWLANPLLFISWLSFKHSRKVSLILNVAAVCFAFLFLLFTKVTVGEDGGKDIIGEYKPGYWLWLSSCLVMLSGNCINFYLDKRKDRANAPS